MIVDNKDRKRISSSGTAQLAAFGMPRPIADGPLPLPAGYCPLSAAHCPPPLPTGRRSGATLLEVLVAIFVMGIGLLALLVLFPLGAFSMAAAIQADRAAQAGAAGSAIANIKDLRRDTAVYNPATGLDYFYDNGATKANLEKRSWPVLLDPVGYRTATNLPAQTNVAGVAGILRRTSASFITGNSDVYRWFTAQDDIVYDKAGNAQAVGVNTIERDVRYSVAYLLQRPRTADPSVVDCTVIVYSGRPLGLSGNLDLAEYAYDGGASANVSFNPGTNTITINYSTMVPPTPPPIRPGDWVLDVSIVSSEPHGFFYRVAGVNDNPTTQVIELEVQQTLRGFPAGGFNGPATTGILTDRARLLFLEGVAEVFERGTGKEPALNP